MITHRCKYSYAISVKNDRCSSNIPTYMHVRGMHNTLHNICARVLHSSHTQRLTTRTLYNINAVGLNDMTNSIKGLASSASPKDTHIYVKTASSRFKTNKALRQETFHPLSSVSIYSPLSTYIIHITRIQLS
jgi:hypothetical protein